MKNWNKDWPLLREYDGEHLTRLALPLGGIGTGTVSLGGRGDLRDWEVVNRPAKGFAPRSRFGTAPFFALWASPVGGESVTRVLEGPLDPAEYEGPFGSGAGNHGLPRFRHARFAAAYPLGQVRLSDPQVPLRVRIEAFNPLVPGDAERSGIPVAVLRFVLENPTARTVRAAICGALQNFVGSDGGSDAPGPRENRTVFRHNGKIRGLFMDSAGVDPQAEQWGSLALTTTARADITHRTAWLNSGWGSSLLDFWDDFSADGGLEERETSEEEAPIGSLATRFTLGPRSVRSVTFLIAWHFPNRQTWTPCPEGEKACCAAADPDRIGNYYATRYGDAFDVAEKVAAGLPGLEEKTVRFVRAFCGSDLPAEVKEAALFNLAHLRSQTCFRTPDGHLYGWEGCGDQRGSCHGSCTHVWNYEQAVSFLFGDLAKRMREVEFGHATDDDGLMSFRVNLPLERARDFGKAAADGQMGCIMKIYRDWQLSGDDDMLEALWPGVKKALEFCWIPGGWDGDRDGVMEGCQHNTMDVEYYGPNPQMGGWYLGALRATEEMARYLGEKEFAGTCRDLFEQGSRWMDEHLFNGEYYEHQVRPPAKMEDVAECLRMGMGAQDPQHLDYQLGPGCLIDQLVGQFMAHVCGLGYLLRPENVRRTLRSIFRYNRRKSLHDHFNCLRSFALGEETALLMASYPRERPANPFPYFTEVMTGFEYAAAIGMLYEGQVKNGLRCIRDIRARYDGRRRSPFDEAECGHHYARAMASWGAVLALTGFRYSGVEMRMTFAAQEGRFFWANGYAWGTCILRKRKSGMRVELEVLHGALRLKQFVLEDGGRHSFERPVRLRPGRKAVFVVPTV